MKLRRLPRPQALRRRAQTGAALIEAMIGILLFCIGILGLVGLQASMSRAQTDAKFRADASNLTTEIVGAMWVDRANLAGYATSPSTVCTAARCAAWVTKVQGQLPSAQASIAVTPTTGTVDVTLTWAPPSEGTRTYVLSTSIR